MFRRIAPAVLLASLAACAAGDERYKEQMFLGEHYFRNGKFEDSVGRYTEAVEVSNGRDEKYKAMVGVGTSASEYGHLLFEQADQLILTKNREAAERTWKRATDMHELANQTFAKLISLRPNDTIANYYRGLLFFKRAASDLKMIYDRSQKGLDQRRKERDEAVIQFQVVLAGEHDDVTIPNHGPNCMSPQAHRYLSLALFGRSDWDKNDGELARIHLSAYLNYVRWLRNHVDKNWSQEDQKQKSDKEHEIERLRQELHLTAGLLKDQLKGIQLLVPMWEQRLKAQAVIADPTASERQKAEAAGYLERFKDSPAITKEQFERRRNAVNKEIMALEGLERKFNEAISETPKGTP